MIMTVEKAKALVDKLDTWNDVKIASKLRSIEQAIRAYTNNNFQDRGYRVSAEIRDGVFMSDALIPFKVGDTVQLTQTTLNDGLYTVSLVDGVTFTVNEEVRDEAVVLCTKIVYPDDVIDCCLNVLEWDLQFRKKVGIQSETLSRHSVTYFNIGASDQIMGFPASLMGCLKAYRKARF